jgi:catechol 2,3-dioxygenase-like lactoylglutathione lyase family enzyme
MEHVGIVVDDLAAATEFFVELGLVLQGEGSKGFRLRTHRAADTRRDHIRVRQ